MKLHRRLLCTALLLFQAAVLRAEVKVGNFKAQDVVRHPVILIRGDVEPGAEKLTLRTVKGTAKPVESTGLVHEGKFKALLELAPGDNTIEIKTERSGLPAKLRITYKPMTNPHYVRLIWLADDQGNTDYATPVEGYPQNYEDRTATAALLLQCFTAERMQELGYGRRTFRLETDRAGKVVVHTIKVPQPLKHYYEMGDGQRIWGELNHFLNTRYPDKNAKNLALMSFTRKDPGTGRMLAHTALGGGNLGLFGSASVFSWPDKVESVQQAFLDDRKYDVSRVHDDSVGRGTYWGLASTTLGATLHEMSHAFGLPHCQDDRCIMTRGFDRLNRFFTFSESLPGRKPEFFAAGSEAWLAPVSASRLRWSPWFQPEDPRNRPEPGPEIIFDAKKDRVTFESRAGIRVLGFWEGSDIRGFQEYKDKAPRKVTLTLEEISSLNGGKVPNKVTAVDENGNDAGLDLKK
ncbi:MAG: metallopeptidase [Verrucomicrobiaceae bacterium]|nr:MAG: metallopeptidase [Verrucomicrobiaceae bacterium]